VRTFGAALVLFAVSLLVALVLNLSPTVCNVPARAADVYECQPWLLQYATLALGVVIVLAWFGFTLLAFSFWRRDRA
jgi:hypothetical protein